MKNIFQKMKYPADVLDEEIAENIESEESGDAFLFEE